MDRGPLDPLSFTSDNDLKDKATKILKALCPGRAKWKVEDGRVILLQGDPKELALRMVITQRKDYTLEKLQTMETRLEDVYGTDGVVCFDTRGLMPFDVARRLAQIVHLEDYYPCDIHKRLKSLEKDGLEGI